jgi:site-specific DNA recombinase
MAKRGARSHELYFEYAFDRLLATKLAQVYDILAPDRIRRTGELSGLKGQTNEDSRDLRQSLVRATEGGEDYRQPDGGVGGVCKKRRL